MPTKEERELRREFRKAVNMSPSTLEKWLAKDKSKKVGVDSDGKKGTGRESVGHRSGRRIVRILRRDPSELKKSDYKHMRKVVGYVRRHSKQRPNGKVKDTKWRYSLMNWGHDPLKK